VCWAATSDSLRASISSKKLEERKSRKRQKIQQLQE
jgi:hypothetical protein